MVKHDFCQVHLGGKEDCVEGNSMPSNGHWIVFYRIDIDPDRTIRIKRIHCTNLTLRDVRKEDGPAKALVAARKYYNRNVKMCGDCYDYGGKYGH